MLTGAIKNIQFRNAISSPFTWIKHTNLMLRSLFDLHLLGYAHNDIKPENFLYKKVQNEIMITKLIDFGVSKLANSEFQGGSVSYMAPERMESPYIATRTADNYSMGYSIFLIRYPEHEKAFSTKAQILNKKSRDALIIERRKTIISVVDRGNKTCSTEYDEDECKCLKAVHKVIKNLTEIDPTQRMDLFNAIKYLEKYITKNIGNSRYLSENAELLFESVYPDTSFFFERYKRKLKNNAVDPFSMDLKDFKKSIATPEQISENMEEYFNTVPETWKYPDQTYKIINGVFTNDYQSIKKHFFSTKERILI